MQRRVPVDHPDFGKAIPCTCQQQEGEEKRLARLLRYSGLEHMTRFTFATMKPEGRRSEPEDQRLFRESTSIAHAFAEKPTGWLVLIGPSGCGKTHLAASIAHHALELGRPAFFITVPDLLDHLRSSFAPESDLPYDTLFEQVRNTPLLVLDDLGLQTVTPWAQEKLFQLLNHRFNLILPTVITVSNPLSKLDERLYTRLTDTAVARVLELGRRREESLFCIGLEAESLSSMTFETFQIDRSHAGADGRARLERALRHCQEFAQAPKDWLLLVGDSGCGKTHLVASIFNTRAKKGEPVAYAWVPALIENLRNAFRPGSPIGYDQLFERVKGAPVLLLDDLGSESTSPWAQERLYQIVAYRYQRRLPTVFATRLLSEELPEALSTRLQDLSFVGVLPLTEPGFKPARQRSSGSGSRKASR
ncbi:MAG: ATP-binding protein [Chloroflexi bacterium]|nr:ATP-binding protein [Chloroflexota bacterium]